MRHENVLKVSRVIFGVQLPSKFWARVAALVALAFLAGGCAGYRLGPSNGVIARDDSVYVEPFTNDTMQPRIEDDFTHALRIDLQREGTYRIGAKSDADIAVKGAIINYSREGLSFNPTDLVQVEVYNLVVTARITAYERATGQKLFERNFSGNSQIRSESDLTSAEREAMPLIANNLARKVVDVLADGDW